MFVYTSVFLCGTVCIFFGTIIYPYYYVSLSIAALDFDFFRFLHCWSTSDSFLSSLNCTGFYLRFSRIPFVRLAGVLSASLFVASEAKCWLFVFVPIVVSSFVECFARNRHRLSSPHQRDLLQTMAVTRFSWMSLEITMNHRSEFVLTCIYRKYIRCAGVIAMFCTFNGCERPAAVVSPIFPFFTSFSVSLFVQSEAP